MDELNEVVELVPPSSPTRRTHVARAAQRLSLVAGELQEQVMKTRMQGLRVSVWDTTGPR